MYSTIEKACYYVIIKMKKEQPISGFTLGFLSRNNYLRFPKKGSYFFAFLPPSIILRNKSTMILTTTNMILTIVSIIIIIS